MTRRLVDLYPCRDCKTPVSVRSRREIPDATCERCSRRRGEVMRARWAWDRAVKKYKEHAHLVHDEWLTVSRWVTAAAADAVDASALLLAAAELNDNTIEAARWVSVARSWSDWAVECLGQVREPLLELGLEPLKVAPPPEAPIELSEPRKGHLRVVLDGGAA